MSSMPTPPNVAPFAKAACSSGGCSTGGGCGSKGQMDVQDWLKYEDLYDLYPQRGFLEVRFKGGRKEFFHNRNRLEIITGDPVVVECASGSHVGYVTMTGPLVELQMRKKNVPDNSSEIRAVYRVATAKDLEKLAEARNRELPALFRTRQLVKDTGLDMKVSDIEFQADGSKAAFYYSAEHRIDFRDLVKNLASEFKVRVDMRQISHRQETGRLGGIGVCGRELCCSTWINDFKTVSTSAARYQNLSLNPAKLSGQCGRLKCCLNYELDTYMTEMVDIPKVEKLIKTQKGEAFLQKTDIFRKLMWFNYKGENTWHVLPTTRVAELLEMNKQGSVPLALTLEEEAQMQAPDDGPINLELQQMDQRFRERDRRRQAGRGNRPKPQTPGEGAPTQGRQGSRRPPRKR